MNQGILNVLALSIVLTKYLGIVVLAGMALCSTALAAELLLVFAAEVTE
ncbi:MULTISPECIES: hypothetical protein [Agarivorans]|uniref:Uncharacterized protein n=1 Tax=Agarivorans albus MKT 106 TaxID=1331007 RepID=R9PQ03_AGAAL|nr:MULTISPECIES: hypothetical protein [Agarivorans]UQN43328.1 hypothetical protein LQZ07_02320 [Agarivorans sp. B2Z047]GAD03380.1 hypothetical protein AALB_3460 [Agarivorans albus MKT 106]